MSFNFNAPKMAKVYTKARHLSKPALDVWKDSILNYVPKSQIKTVLDLGCGSGRFIPFLQELFKKAKIIGIEPSKEMLGEAKKSLKGRQVIFIKSKAEAIPLKGKSVDLIFLSMVYHTLKVEKATLEMLRVLKPKGYVIVRQADRETVKQDPLWPFFPEAGKVAIQITVSRRQLIKSFIKAGFKLTGLRNVKYPVAKNFNEYAKRISLRGISPLQMIPDKVFNERFKEFKKYCQSHKNQGPVYEFRDLFVFQKP